MSFTPSSRARLPQDQAHGLRQMFSGQEVLFVPLVHNRHVSHGGVVMERICTAMSDRGFNTLVVDAADTASPPHELAQVDLAACVEPLSARVSYLAARGLTMLYLDARATTAGFLQALTEASPQADVVLIHAGASDLRRMFAGRTPRPILMAGGRPASLTEAYAAMKLLSQRLGALTYDVILTADVSDERAQVITDRLAECGDHFLGAAVGLTAVVDPAGHPRAPAEADLQRLVAAQTRRLEPAQPGWSSPAAGLPVPAARAARAGSRSRLN